MLNRNSGSILVRWPALGNSHSVEPTVVADKEQLARIGAPHGLAASKPRNAGPAISIRQKRFDVDLVAARLARGIRQPLAVWRHLWLEIGGRCRHYRPRHACPVSGRMRTSIDGCLGRKPMRQQQRTELRIIKVLCRSINQRVGDPHGRRRSVRFLIEDSPAVRSIVDTLPVGRPYRRSLGARIGGENRRRLALHVENLQIAVGKVGIHESLTVRGQR